MQKLDLKKQWKDLYQPRPGVIAEVNVPPLRYLMIDGAGDPNTAPAYQQAIEALYALAYTLKFSLKKSPEPVDYGVMPLEGLWWADDPRAFLSGDKAQWKWTAMIMQPEFITAEQFASAVVDVRRKKNPLALDSVRFDVLDEGLAMQVLHLGPFSAEGPVLQQMHDRIHAQGRELHGRHHEVYLSDPRRTAPEKLKTILRQPMR